MSFMMTSDQRAMLRSSGIVVARILLGLLFFLGGVNMLMSGGGPAEMIANIGFPAAGLLAWVVVAVKVLGGAGLILGYRTGLSAAALFAFTLLTVVFVHADMEDPSLFKNLSIMGGLLYAMAYGPGEGWRLGK